MKESSPFARLLFLTAAQLALHGCSTADGSDSTTSMTEETEGDTDDEATATEEQTSQTETDLEGETEENTTGTETTDAETTEATTDASETDSEPTDAVTDESDVEPTDSHPEETTIDAGPPDGPEETDAEPPDPAVDAGLDCDAPAACSLVECAVPQQTGNHVDYCSDLSPHSNPPTSGEHYPAWAQFGIYDEPIMAGFLLHTLEHSAIALLYNCEEVEALGDSCEDLIAELNDFYDEYPLDPLCTDVPHRLVVAPAPDLDAAFAAVAWGYHLKGDCFDTERVSAFIGDHYGNNYENLCNSGIDPSEAGCE